MSTVRLFLLITILVLTGGMTLMNLYTFDRALAVESNCDPKIRSLLGCPLGSDNEESFAIASAKTVAGQKENPDIGIDITDSTSGVSVVIGENNADDDTNPNIESLIPSTINAIPFP
jgi:hypothetical protein